LTIDSQTGGINVGAGSGDFLQLYTNNNTAQGIRITSGGLVGIGTSTVSETLTVAGTGSFTGTVSGADAVNTDDFVTLSQLNTAVSGAGTVTSVDVSGGSTGLSFSGGPVTSSGTITMAGTLGIGNGGTGATSASGARTNLGATTVGANLFT